MLFRGRGGAGRVFKTSKWSKFFFFAFDSVVHFYGDQLYILFWWIWPPICTLSKHCRRTKLTKVSCFFFVFFFEKLFLFFLSLRVYIHVKKICTWLFVAKKKKSFFSLLVTWTTLVNHSDGIKFFFCTEPPRKEVTEWERLAEGQIWDYNFSVASLTNEHSTHRLRMIEELDVRTFSLGAGRTMFMEVLLMMCLGKSYFLKKEAEIVPINPDCSVSLSHFYL